MARAIVKKQSTWVKVVQTVQADVAATYSRTLTTVTVTATNHGHIVGHVVYADFTSGTATDGLFTITSVPDANTFTFTHGVSGSTSGNVTLKRHSFVGENIHSVTDNAAAAGSSVVNFSAPFANNDYGAAAMGLQGSSGNYGTVVYHGGATAGANTNIQTRFAFQFANQGGGSGSQTDNVGPTHLVFVG